jgi:SPX domain protein involved in polyphosphate accumulation
MEKSNALQQHNLQRSAKVFRKISKTMQKVVQLEKYAVLNYTGFLKLLKRHDKKTPFKIKQHFETILNSQAFSSLKGTESRMRELETLKQSLNTYLEEKRSTLVCLISFSRFVCSFIFFNAYYQ